MADFTDDAMSTHLRIVFCHSVAMPKFQIVESEDLPHPLVKESIELSSIMHGRRCAIDCLPIAKTIHGCEEWLRASGQAAFPLSLQDLYLQMFAYHCACAELRGYPEIALSGILTIHCVCYDLPDEMHVSALHLDTIGNTVNPAPYLICKALKECGGAKLDRGR